MSIAFVSSATFGSENVSTPVTSFAMNAQAVTTGNTIVVFARVNSSTVTAVTDTIGNTYTKVTGASGGAANQISTWVCAASTGTNASNVITVGNGSTDSITFYSAHVQQFSGFSGGASVDVASFRTATSATPWTSNSFSTAQASEVVCICATATSSETALGTPTVAGVAATTTTSAPGGSPDTLAAYQLQSGTLSGVTATMLPSGASSCVFSVLSLMAAGGGGAPTPSTFSVSDPAGFRIPGIH